MEDNLTNGEIKSIVENLVEELRKCPEGTRISTAQLLRKAGYEDDFDMIDLFAVHNELLEAARKNKIILDLSEHEGKVEGLLFNLDFIIHNADKH